MTDRYDELRAAAEAATPGPWVAYNRAGEGAPDEDFLGWDFEEFNGPPEPERGVLMGRDMRFVVLARRDIPALLSERDSLLAALNRIAAIPETVCEPFQDGLAAQIAAAALTTKEG